MKNKILLILIISLVIIGIILFSFYIEREIGIFFDIFVLPVIIVVLLIICMALIIPMIKNKKYDEYKVVLIPMITFFLSMLIIRLNVPNNIALLIELPKIEKEIAEYKTTGLLQNNIRIDGNYIAIDWLLGVTDNWSAIIYDENNSLGNAIKIIQDNKTNFFNKTSFNNYRKIFSGDLIGIKKVKDKLYLCTFT